MPEISLTDFVDFASASGSSKLTKVRQIKHRPDYAPAFDFYKKVREGIVECHRAGDPRTRLASHLGPVTDSKKKRHYADVLAGYRRWWGRKAVVWFDPSRATYSERGIDIRINPELGLRVDGAPHLIKLYFKSDKLTKARVEVITHLMDKALSGTPPGARMGVLDVRNARLVTPTVPIAGLDAMLAGELAYMAATWASV